MKSSQLNDFFVVFGYLFAAFIVVYFLPQPISKFAFLIVLPLVWYSKKDFIWLAFFFVLEDHPGGLFSGGERDSIYRIPIYSLVAGVSFSIRELYLLLLLAKILLKKKYHYNFQKPFFWSDLKKTALLFAALIIITPFLGGTFDGYRNIAKITINLSLFYSIFFIIPDKETFVKFLQALFPFTILALLLQLYGLTFNQQLVGLFQSDIQITQGVFDTEGKGVILARPVELTHILLINFTATLFLIHTNISRLTKNYLWVVNVLSFISIFMSATRTWFIAMIAAYILFTLLSRNSTKILIRYMVLGVFITFVGLLIPAISKQITAAWGRIDTIQLILQGDITAGGTIQRYDKRAPAVMDAFMESTVIFGDAFGKLHQQYQDSHVGYHNLLLNVGIIGSLVFLIFIIKLLLISFINQDSRNILSVAAIALVMVLILNAGTQFIGFNVDGTTRFFFQAYVLALLSTAFNMVYRPESMN